MERGAEQNEPARVGAQVGDIVLRGEQAVDHARHRTRVLPKGDAVLVFVGAHEDSPQRFIAVDADGEFVGRAERALYLDQRAAARNIEHLALEHLAIGIEHGGREYGASAMLLQIPARRNQLRVVAAQHFRFQKRY